MGEVVPACAGRAAGPRRQVMTATALRGLSQFADARGVPPGGEFLLDYDVIEAFCVAGLAGRAPAPGARTGRRCTGSPKRRTGRRGSGDAVPGARAPAPYSPAERAELAAVAAAQRDPAKRASALAMVVFGIGAGLRPGELVALRGDEFPARPPVMVRVSGPAARVGWLPHAMPAGQASWPAGRATACIPPRPGRPRL